MNIHCHMLILHCHFPGGLHFKLKTQTKGETSLIAEYVLEMALLLATDGLKINVYILQGVLHDIPFTF